MHNMVDIVTKKLLSIIFRVILLSFALLIYFSKDNLFPYYYYLLAFIPYLFIYKYTLFKDGPYSILRLLNDYSFITLLLYGKELDITSISFLFLPILNSSNHSGEKKSILLYAVFFISFLILNDFIFSSDIIFCTLFFWLINFLVDSKQRFYNNISALNNQIELFFEDDFELRKNYKIYDGLISTLNKIFLLLVYKPKFENIICFKVKKGKLVIINSSSFLWSFNIDFNLIEPIINGKVNIQKHSNLKLNINGKECTKNFVIAKNSKHSQYLYIVQLVETSQSFSFFNLYYINLLKPIFSRISRVLDLELILKTQNKEILEDFKKKYFHVKNAEKAMHFIKNRFNTLDNFIAMSKDNIAGNMDNEDMELYKLELKNVEHNFNMLIDRAKNILNKSDKPYSASTLELKSPSFLYDAIRGIWMDYFVEFNYQLNWDIIKTFSYNINLNVDGLFLLIDDWVCNMQKYSLGHETILFNETKESLIIVFQNQFNHSALNEIEELMNDFNSTEKDKILKRTTTGILLIKDILEEMLIKAHIEVDRDPNKIKLILSFKKTYNENSNI